MSGEWVRLESGDSAELLQVKVLPVLPVLRKKKEVCAVSGLASVGMERRTPVAPSFPQAILRLRLSPAAFLISPQ